MQSCGNNVKGKTRGTQMDQERLNWCREEILRMDNEFKVVRKYKSISKTTGRMRNLGQIITDEGGWKDKAGIKGSVIACAQCAAMGPPWAGRHPMTKRVLYRVLEFESEELFEE